MSGGFPHSAFRLPRPVATAAPVVLATLALSGCALFRAPQAPAPVVEAVAVPVEPASEPVAAPEPASAPEPAEAAAPKKPRREAAPPRKPARAAPPPPPAPSPAPLVTTRAIERSQVHALLDSEVRRGGKVIGRAVDMTADASGAPREMLVNLQGFMGVGDRKVSFPWKLFRFTPGGRQEPIVLDMPAATQLPPADRPKAVPLTGSTHAGADPGQMRIIDADVERPNGAKVGRVVDVLIGRDAQPQAVVLDVGGLVDPDRHTIAANWSALRFAPKDKSPRALLDLNEAQLKASPPYAGDKPILAVSPGAPAAAPAAAQAGAKR
ncbi:photosystem reaction center subunit H [Burkholderia sp. ABCPW 14]|uniref:photosystem reaction center subunit H n=1 Tax=Burkholderia sp. ABCPW 14 TaxID=1637860 RepID=UPI000770BF8C|nr:photosystem reaction center subunit H [Burkholderia sp. ABCPW 14]KVD78818.1 photosystem reaction center subunit H [Burkholderia sp. ABCPW 14]